MIKKIANLKGRIDCPYCFSLLQWDSVTDVHIFGGNKYVICPECNQHLMLDPKRDYWFTEKTDGGDDSGDDSGEGGQGGDDTGRVAVVGTAIVGQDKVGG